MRLSIPVLVLSLSFCFVRSSAEEETPEIVDDVGVEVDEEEEEGGNRYFRAGGKAGGRQPIGAQNQIGYNGGYPRFSKIQWSANEPYSYDFLGKNDYPLQYSRKLSKVEDSFCPSVTMPNDYEINDSIDKMVAYVGQPSHPFYQNGKPDYRYWDEFRFVCQVQIFRRKFGNSLCTSIMPGLPKLWRDFTINECAEAVHGEYPADWQSKYLADGAKNKDPYEASGPFHWDLDDKLVPKRSRTQFLRSIVAMSKFNTYAVDKVGPVNFAAKYYCGRARPEEIAYKIATGRITAYDGVPQDIIDMVHSMNLRKMEEFTAYKNGSPQHPSYPAMHSAASSLSVWLPIVAKLTQEELIEAIKTDVAVACARTIAGVHYVSDNMAGLKMGQAVLYNDLADYMVEHYGSNRNAVEAKMKKVKFLWDQYMDEYCNIQLPPVY